FLRREVGRARRGEAVGEQIGGVGVVPHALGEHVVCVDDQRNTETGFTHARRGRGDLNVNHIRNACHGHSSNVGVVSTDSIHVVRSSAPSETRSRAFMIARDSYSVSTSTVASCTTPKPKIDTPEM